MQWLAQALHKYPELAVFLVVGLGYWIGALAVGPIVLASGATVIVHLVA